MRIFACISLLFFLLAASTTFAGERQGSCVPLNSSLSICIDVEGVEVSFVDATPTAVLGTARLTGRDDLLYVFQVSWDIGTSLETYAREHAREAAQHETSDLVLEEPVSLVVEGFPAVRYDLLPLPGAGPSGQPKTLLFVDTGAGIAVFMGSPEPKRSGVTPDDLYSGAKSLARILHVGN